MVEDSEENTVMLDVLSARELISRARVKGINNSRLNLRRDTLIELVESNEKEENFPNSERPHAIPVYFVFQGLNEWKEWWYKIQNSRDMNGEYVSEININSQTRVDNVKDPIRSRIIQDIRRYSTRFLNKHDRHLSPYILLFGTDEEEGLDGKFIVHGDHPHDSSYICENGPSTLSFYSSKADTVPQGLEIIIDLDKFRENFIDILRNKRDKNSKPKNNVETIPITAVMYRVYWDTEFDWYRNSCIGLTPIDGLTDFNSFDGTERIESMIRVSEEGEKVVLTDLSCFKRYDYNERKSKIKKSLQLVHLSREEAHTKAFRSDIISSLKLIGVPYNESNYEVIMADWAEDSRRDEKAER
tara:strand:- start:844 stop:1914 length:1071 start_codon:yes stop_codon:yes gene_type:complete